MTKAWKKASVVNNNPSSIILKNAKSQRTERTSFFHRFDHCAGIPAIEQKIKIYVSRVYEIQMSQERLIVRWREDGSFG